MDDAPSPMKRARLLTPAPTPLPREDRILLVLRTPQLFQLISQWEIRWPDRLASQWHTFQKSLIEREHGRLRHGFSIPKAHRIELFMRELMRTRDAVTLRLAAQSTWRDDGNNGGVRHAFPMQDLKFAVWSGDGAMLRVALEFATTTVSTTLQSWLWREAMVHCRGDYSVLDALKLYTKPTLRFFQYYKDHSKNAHAVHWMTTQLEAANVGTKESPTIKRARRDPPPMNTTPFRVVGNAAFRVLTTHQLFRLLPPYMDGWPTRLLTKWRESSAQIDDAEALRVRRGFAIPKKRKVELFMRALMVAGDVETLRLTGVSHWHDSSSIKRCFPVNELQFAIRAGHTATVEWAFQQLARGSSDGLVSFSHTKRQWLWTEAMDPKHFPGHCGVLDVLHTYIPLPVDPDSHAWIRADTIQCVSMAKWIVARWGAASLSPSMMVVAAGRGDLLLTQYVATVPGQDVTAAVALGDTYTTEIRAFVETLGNTKEDNNTA